MSRDLPRPLACARPDQPKFASAGPVSPLHPTRAPINDKKFPRDRLIQLVVYRLRYARAVIVICLSLESMKSPNNLLAKKLDGLFYKVMLTFA